MSGIRFPRPRRGFTLIELLVVIAIIAVSDRAAAARRPGGPRGRPPCPVHQQPQAVGVGHPELHLAEQFVPADAQQLQHRRHRPPQCEGARELAHELDRVAAAVLRAGGDLQRGELRRDHRRSPEPLHRHLREDRHADLSFGEPDRRPVDPTNMASYRGNTGGPGSLLSWSGPIVPMTPNATTSPGNGTNNNANMGSVGMQGITDGTSNTAAISEKLIGSNILHATSPPATGSGRCAGCSLQACSSTWTSGAPRAPSRP